MQFITQVHTFLSAHTPIKVCENISIECATKLNTILVIQDATPHLNDVCVNMLTTMQKMLTNVYPTNMVGSNT